MRQRPRRSVYDGTIDEHMSLAMVSRKSLALLARSLVALALTAGVSRAQTVDAPRSPVALEQDKVERGDTVWLSISNGPVEVKHAEIRLEGNGAARNLSASAPRPANGAPTLVSATIPSSKELPPVALGKYTVSARLDGVPFVAPRALSIVPVGNPDLHLRELAPAMVEKTQRAFFDDGGKKPAAANDVVHLVLRGSGFQTERPEDNLILVNDIPQKVSWTKCEQLAFGTAEVPVPRQIVAEAVSGEEIRLCMVPVPPQGELLMAVGRGDVVSERRSFRVLSMGRQGVVTLSAAIAVLLALLPLALLGLLKQSREIGPSKSKYKLRLLFLDAETDTYSLSKLQFYLWTVAALFGYAYLFISRVLVQHVGWPDVPGSLPGIIAVAAGTSIGAQVITAARGSTGAGAEQPSFADLIMAGGVVAPDRVQMLLWTLAGVGGFVIVILQLHPGAITDLPPVPENLLYLSGLSSAGYLGGKLARKPGPVINEISVTPSEPDDALASADPSLEEMPDFTLAVTQARTEQALLPVPQDASASAATSTLANAIASVTAAITPAAIDRLVADLSVWRATAHEQAATVAKAYAAADDSTPARAAAKAAAAADAGLAQRAAAIVQELSVDVTRAIARAAAPSIRAALAPQLVARALTLRGTNLSSEGMFEIDGVDLPFRMLTSSAGSHAPDILLRDTSIPTFARALRLTIDPARLETTDRAIFQKWFASSGTRTFSLINPDGQKAELTFSLPPGEAQKTGTAP